MTDSNSSNPKKKNRILAVLPIPCGVEWGYWYRDVGLIVRILRSRGYDAWLVAFRSEEGLPRAGEPVIVASKEELEDPSWWKSQAPDAAILNLWGASRWEGVRAAARQATPHLVEKLDTAGIYSPRISFWRYFYDCYWQSRDVGVFPFMAALKNLIRTCALGVMPGLLDNKRVECLARMPILAAESPVAVERTKRYLRIFGGKKTQVLCVPHPVDEAGMETLSGTIKENKIVCVGRWEAHQKNFPLLLETLGYFLALHSDWSADVLGSLPADAKARLGKLHGSVASRINLAGSMPHDQLARHYRISKIFFMSSRYESFNIAAAEALCWGCSVVGSVLIPTVPFFTGRNSGTPASRYSCMDLLDALCVEVEAWKGGQRDPAAISESWKATVGAEAVTGKILEAIENL